MSILRSVRNPVQSHPRCQGCYLCEEDGYDEAVLYIEKWNSEQDLHQHIRSDLYSRILAAAELSHSQPEFHFHYVKESRGMDLVELVRTQKSREKMNHTT